MNYQTKKISGIILFLLLVLVIFFIEYITLTLKLILLLGLVFMFKIFYKKKQWIEFLRDIIVGPIVISVLAIVISEKYYKPGFFDINVRVKTDNIEINSNYPKLSDQARVRFYFPSETKEKEVTFSNEIILNKISNSLKNKYLKVELIDKYWKLSTDSLLLKNGLVDLMIKPNEKLSIIEGKVKDRFGEPLYNAVIEVDSLETKTDKYGRFSLSIPVNLRKIQYSLTIKKQDFLSKYLEYTAGHEREIRLYKIKK